MCKGLWRRKTAACSGSAKAAVKNTPGYSKSRIFSARAAQISLCLAPHLNRVGSRSKCTPSHFLARTRRRCACRQRRCRPRICGGSRKKRRGVEGEGRQTAASSRHTAPDHPPFAANVQQVCPTYLAVWLFAQITPYALLCAVVLGGAAAKAMPTHPVVDAQRVSQELSDSTQAPSKRPPPVVNVLLQLAQLVSRQYPWPTRWNSTARETSRTAWPLGLALLEVRRSLMRSCAASSARRCHSAGKSRRQQARGHNAAQRRRARGAIVGRALRNARGSRCGRTGPSAPGAKQRIGCGKPAEASVAEPRRAFFQPAHRARRSHHRAAPGKKCVRGRRRRCLYPQSPR